MPRRRISAYFRDLSFQRKLVFLATATSGAALLLAALSFAILEAVTARATLLGNVELTADLIGANSAAALLFGDSATAAENLSVPGSLRNIRAAVLYDHHGALFASFHRPGASTVPPSRVPSFVPHAFDLQHLRVMRPVVHRRDTAGTVLIISDIRDLYDRLLEIAVFLLAGLAVITFVAYRLSARIQHLVADPLLELAAAARGVTLEGDYSIRVHKRGNDEIGELADRFNEMLDAIHERDAALQQEIAIRTRAQEELHDFAARLEASNRELQDFASIASHDLQEPLRKVLAFSDRLRSSLGGTLDERSADFMERMLNATRRMQTLINDLLTYSRVTSKAKPFAPVDLHEIVTQVLSDLEIRIEQSHARIALDPLPVIDGDGTQMRQLFQNLIGNALKFHRPDVPPEVTIRCTACVADLEQGGAFVEISISDNGIGFDDKYREQIFVIFQRLHGRTDYEGTGIGLAVCKKIVDRHGGSVIASGIPGEGATFALRLPRVHDSSSD
jgi:signal transduction histidine kinase